MKVKMEKQFAGIFVPKARFYLNTPTPISLVHKPQLG